MVNLRRAINLSIRPGGIALLFLTLCQIVQADIFGEGKWEWLYPWPSSFSLMDIEFVSENEGWIVGGSGTILHTQNGGETWERQVSKTTTSFYTVEFLDNRNGWCAGGADEIWRTTDGGEHWIPSNLGYHIGNVYDLKFANLNLGWAVGFAIWRTKDGGVSWEELPQPEGLRVYDIEIAQSGTLWAIAHVDTVYAPSFVMFSEDSGATWERVTIPEDALPYSMAVLTDSTIWIGGFQTGTTKGTLYKTDDRGNTWQPTNLDSVPVIADIKFVDSLNGWAAAKPLIRTTDGGNTWTVTELCDTSSNWSLECPSPQVCWTGGAFGALCKTTDGGETWTQQREYVDEGIFNIQHVGTEHIWALGSPAGGSTQNRGGIYRSADGGQTWSRWQNPAIRHPHGLSMVNEGVGFVTEYYSGLWATYDGGENWENIPSVPDTFVHSVYAASESTVYVLGRHRIVVTYDGGQTWQDMGIPTDIPLIEISEPLPGVMLAYGGEYAGEIESRGVILIRYGESPWQVLCENDSMYFVDVQMTGENDLWAMVRVQWDINFIHSSDRGTTWRYVEFDSWGFRSIKMFSNDIGMAQDWNYRVFVTEDGWRTSSVDTSYFQYGVSDFTLIGNYIFGSAGGAIVKREVASNLFSRIIPVPDDFIVSVYPNPFNSSVSIRLNVPQFSHVEAELYDVLGRRVDEIFHGQLSSQTIAYTIPFSVASGSYFVKATASGHTATRKIVLLK